MKTSRVTAVLVVERTGGKKKGAPIKIYFIPMRPGDANEKWLRSI